MDNHGRNYGFWKPIILKCQAKNSCITYKPVSKDELVYDKIIDGKKYKLVEAI